MPSNADTGGGGGGIEHEHGHIGVEPPILAKLPRLTVRAGPRDGAQWIARLKEELSALIEFTRMNQRNDSDWFEVGEGCIDFAPICDAFLRRVTLSMLDAHLTGSSAA